MHNIWAAKAQQKKDKGKQGKGKGKGNKGGAKEKKQPAGAGLPAGSAGIKGVKRTGGGAGVSARHKRPRPAGSRSSSRHATISPVFADTVRIEQLSVPCIDCLSCWVSLIFTLFCTGFVRFVAGLQATVTSPDVDGPAPVAMQPAAASAETSAA